MLFEKSVAIVGCGWLGQALAKALLAEHYHVVGTCQSQETNSILTEIGVTAELLTLPLKGTKNSNNCQYQLVNCRTLVICITPQLRYGKSDYVEKITQLVELAQHGKVAQIILINSTAIYGGLQGLVTENSTLDVSAPKVNTLQQAEAVVLGSGLAAVSLRVAGLVGPNRLPGNFFKPGRVLTEPNAPVNLVHQQDVVQCIKAIINKPQTTGIFNVSSNTEIPKQLFYQQAALALGNAVPEFEHDKNSHLGKHIVSNKIRQALAISFQYDDLLHWLGKNKSYTDWY